MEDSYHLIVTTVTSILFGSGAGGAITLWLNKRNQIEINKEAEKIKYEMQRQHLHTQIKTTNLVEIYPKLSSLALQAAWHLPGMITTIQEKMSEENLDEKQIQELINDCFYEFIANREKSLTPFIQYSNYLSESAIFLSPEIFKRGVAMRTIIGSLRKIVKDEIVTGKFNKYSKEECSDLIVRMNNTLQNLNDERDKIIAQMRYEIYPY